MEEKRIVETTNGDCLVITNEGNVYHKGKLLKKCKYEKTGYLYVTHQRSTYLIHRLVASAFIQPLKRGDRSIQVHHINGDKSDNCVENLEVMSAQEHQHIHKQKYSVEKICVVCGNIFIPNKTKRKRQKACSPECQHKLMIKNHLRIPINQYDLNGNFIKRWDSAREAQKELGIFESNINKCCNGIIKTYKGYIWKYTEFKSMLK